MAKSKNPIETVRLTLATTPGVVAYLERLSQTHLYGKNAAETAEQIVRHEIARLLKSGELAALTARELPASKVAKPESEAS
jgi:hypothetical protein